MAKQVIPYALCSPDKDIVSVEQAFKKLFGKSISIKTVNIRGGKTSAVIYVPKEFKDKVATVIIWDKPLDFYENTSKDDPLADPLEKK
jgi:hypothetical protein